MKIKNFAFLISIILIFIVALGAVSADEGLNDHSAIYGDNGDIDDDSDYEDDDWDDDTELDDADGNNENVPMATSGSASFDDGAENASSEDLSSKNQIDLANKATGHPILMLILSLFALFVIPANKR